jgi:hypothetical protein
MKRIKSKGGHTRRKYYSEMREDEGEWCKICGEKPPNVYLEIHFKDGNHNNTARSNRVFACRSDNRRLDPRGKGKRKKGLNASIIDQPKVGSAEFQKNREAEPKFRHWLYEMISKHGRMTLDDVINSGAEIAGVSPITAKRYLQKLCSGAGMYVIMLDSTMDQKVVEFRAPESIGVSSDILAQGL